jgi:2'-5' RNA ligase
MTAADTGLLRGFVRAAPRLFIAVPLAEPARAEVEALVAEVRSRLAEATSQVERPKGRRTDVRWVRMDGLHLTLRFLGPTSADQVSGLVSAIDGAAARRGPFDVEISGGGAFPTPAKPRTLWLGITRGQDELKALAEDVSERLGAVGWPLETRSFRGHLTLGRSDGRPDGRAAVSLLTERAHGFRTRFRAERLVLFESVTGGGPARYEPVHEARLAS